MGRATEEDPSPRMDRSKRCHVTRMNSLTELQHILWIWQKCMNNNERIEIRDEFKALNKNNACVLWRVSTQQSAVLVLPPEEVYYWVIAGSVCSSWALEDGSGSGGGGVSHVVTARLPPRLFTSTGVYKHPVPWRLGALGCAAGRCGLFSSSCLVFISLSRRSKSQGTSLASAVQTELKASAWLEQPEATDHSRVPRIVLTPTRPPHVIPF